MKLVDSQTINCSPEETNEITFVGTCRVASTMALILLIGALPFVFSAGLLSDALGDFVLLPFGLGLLVGVFKTTSQRVRHTRSDLPKHAVRFLIAISACAVNLTIWKLGLPPGVTYAVMSLLSIAGGYITGNAIGVACDLM